MSAHGRSAFEQCFPVLTDVIRTHFGRRRGWVHWGFINGVSSEEGIELVVEPCFLLHVILFRTESSPLAIPSSRIYLLSSSDPVLLIELTLLHRSFLLDVIHPRPPHLHRSLQSFPLP